MLNSSWNSPDYRDLHSSKQAQGIHVTNDPQNLVAYNNSHLFYLWVCSIEMNRPFLLHIASAVGDLNKDLTVYFKMLLQTGSLDSARYIKPLPGLHDFSHGMEARFQKWATSNNYVEALFSVMS